MCLPTVLKTAGCRCRVDAEEDGDWAGSNSSGVVLQLSHTHAMVEYDEYDDEHGRKLREQVAVERLQPAYPDGFESGRNIKCGMGVDVTLADDPSRWPGTAACQDKDGKWWCLMEDKSLKKASHVRPLVQWDEDEQRFKARSFKVHHVKESRDAEGNFDGYAYRACIHKTWLRSNEDKWLTVGVDDNIMTSAAAADMSQWVVAEVIKQELTEVPGWDSVNNWNFMEPKDADKVVYKNSGEDPKEFKEMLADNIRKKIQQQYPQLLRGVGPGGAGAGAPPAHHGHPQYNATQQQHMAAQQHMLMMRQQAAAAQGRMPQGMHPGMQQVAAAGGNGNYYGPRVAGAPQMPGASPFAAGGMPGGGGVAGVKRPGGPGGVAVGPGAAGAAAMMHPAYLQQQQQQQQQQMYASMQLNMAGYGAPQQQQMAGYAPAIAAAAAAAAAQRPQAQAAGGWVPQQQQLLAAQQAAGLQQGQVAGVLGAAGAGMPGAGAPQQPPQQRLGGEEDAYAAMGGGNSPSKRAKGMGGEVLPGGAARAGEAALAGQL